MAPKKPTQRMRPSSGSRHTAHLRTYSTAPFQTPSVEIHPGSSPSEVFFLLWLQMAFIAIWYMLINMFALQHLVNTKNPRRMLKVPPLKSSGLHILVFQDRSERGKFNMFEKVIFHQS